MATGPAATTASWLFGEYCGCVQNVPQNWSDLLKPEYKGQVACRVTRHHLEPGHPVGICSRFGQWWFPG